MFYTHRPNTSFSVSCSPLPFFPFSPLFFLLFSLSFLPSFPFLSLPADFWCGDRRHAAPLPTGLVLHTRHLQNGSPPPPGHLYSKGMLVHRPSKLALGKKYRTFCMVQKYALQTIMSNYFDKFIPPKEVFSNYILIPTMMSIYQRCKQVIFCKFKSSPKSLIASPKSMLGVASQVTTYSRVKSSHNPVQVMSSH